MLAALKPLFAAAAVGAVALLAGCYTVPETGRQALVIVSPEEEAQLGIQAFQEIRAQEPLSNDPALLARVARVGQRIVTAVGDDVPTAQWEFAVFDSPELNAFALPGGKVGIYTGILNLATTDDELAIVIGHEIAHVTARHGGERLSVQQGLALGGAVLGGAAQGQLSQGALQAVQLAYGIGSQLAVLPHSRLQETEADRIGLRYAARAGYDPRAALTFWQKMNQQAQASGVPKFLRTHPSGEDRMQELQQEMAQVVPLYEEALRGSGLAAPRSAEIGSEIGREIGR